MSAPSLRFTKDDLIAALEARRPWAKALDAKNLKAHKADERKALAEFRANLRCSLKATYDELTAERGRFGRNRDLSSVSFNGPSCPRSVEAMIDTQLAYIRPMRQKTMTISAEGNWRDVFYVLTHDENAPKGDLC